MNYINLENGDVLFQGYSRPTFSKIQLKTESEQAARVYIACLQTEGARLPARFLSVVP